MITDIEIIKGSVIQFSGFTEVPVSQMVSVGEAAVFRCQHPTADIISWKTNDTSVTNERRPPGVIPGIDVENGSLVYTLTVMGQPEYNGTVVVGVARFFSPDIQDQETPNATLQGMQINCSYTSRVDY